VDLVSGRWCLVGVLIATAMVSCSQRARDIQGGAELKQAVDQMMAPVERATGLKFKRHPVVLRRSRAQVRQYVIHNFDQDVTPAEFAGVQAAYRLFGLLPDSLDLRGTMIDLLTEQVAGYYDADSNALYIPADIDPAQARLVISHELVHALQAQYVDLDSLIQQRNQNDRRSAAQAVLEGQATLAQILVLMPEQKVESLPNFWELRDALGQQQQQMTIFAHAPMWLRESLIFPYLAGAEFVRWFARTHPGEEPFGALMPTSTTQILHPDRYLAGDRPTTLAFLAPAPDTVRYENDLGEFETRLLLQQYLDSEPESAALAAGWAGDRYQVLGGAADVLVWYSVWDNAAAADRFAGGLKRAWGKRRPGGPTVRRSDIVRLLVAGRAGVRLVDAPAGWVGWKQLPTVKVTPPPLGITPLAK
jgi:hypothetical protein